MLIRKCNGNYELFLFGGVIVVIGSSSVIICCCYGDGKRCVFLVWLICCVCLIIGINVVYWGFDVCIVFICFIIEVMKVVGDVLLCCLNLLMSVWWM